MSKPFSLTANYQPSGDQPQAIDLLCQGLNEGLEAQTLLGVTGSGKTFTMANVIQRVQRPTLVISHNKTLAAQLYNELREFFPDNAVEYFISYYDYYQPEAYIPRTDTYIEKTASINEEIDRLRHSTTRSLFERRDVIVVSSVSCIYGLGLPDNYFKAAIRLQVGGETDRDELLMTLIRNQYQRNDLDLKRAHFRARGDIIEIHPAHEEVIIRLELFGDELERISMVDPETGEVLEMPEEVVIYPAIHYVANRDDVERATRQIQFELDERLRELYDMGKMLEAQRLEQRTIRDLEMIREVGYCNGIENYSRIFEDRPPGTPPKTLLDYFSDDFLLIIDESHVTVPQLRGMYHGDRARKETLVDYGFRLPCAKDNRPLMFEEFWERVGQRIYVSATPAQYEVRESRQIAQQIIRPTGLLDPIVEVRPTANQVDNLLEEIQARVARNERVLITTLTKRMAEDLTEYFETLSVKVRYLHSEIKPIERMEIIRDLRLGDFDVLIGVNLLREGLDLPEVTLVVIMDADKEGFLRSESSLIQTIGRAARNAAGMVILYADKVTESMQKAMDETARRRDLQMAYNKRNGITPKTIQKAIGYGLLDMIGSMGGDEEVSGDGRHGGRKGSRKPQPAAAEAIPAQDLPALIAELELEMKAAARMLEFEKAARLRDQMVAFKKALENQGVS
ncbi:excinuclease ABC subunit UvrB [Vampirovibrio chlorellavorus]|uniref:excinuclease ABC subunit UvrB n=1 Tax=Vampirovibrio chlorellavorus TaxID=758823 RepID=UPI0026ED5B7A|nr:excinuclease ABC subunit UvrB [Vampirovibrio chlorellavorus]